MLTFRQIYRLVFCCLADFLVVGKNEERKRLSSLQEKGLGLSGSAAKEGTKDLL